MKLSPVSIDHIPDEIVILIIAHSDYNVWPKLRGLNKRLLSLFVPSLLSSFSTSLPIIGNTFLECVDSYERILRAERHLSDSFTYLKDTEFNAYTCPIFVPVNREVANGQNYTIECLVVGNTYDCTRKYMFFYCHHAIVKDKHVPVNINFIIKPPSMVVRNSPNASSDYTHEGRYLPTHQEYLKRRITDKQELKMLLLTLIYSGGKLIRDSDSEY